MHSVCCLACFNVRMSLDPEHHVLQVVSTFTEMSVPLRVAVRIRPTQAHDGKAGPPAVVPLDGTSLEVVPEGPKGRLEFNNVFGPQASQHEVFVSCCLPLVEAVLEGKNGCIFAFGQTGAGKTHSMIGPEGGQRRGTQDGILPRAAAELFRRIARIEVRPHCLSRSPCPPLPHHVWA